MVFSLVLFFSLFFDLEFLLVAKDQNPPISLKKQIRCEFQSDYELVYERTQLKLLIKTAICEIDAQATRATNSSLQPAASTFSGSIEYACPA